METMFDEQRVARLEQQVEFLFRHLGLDPAAATDPRELPRSFYDAVNEGGGAAVNIYRAATGASMEDAFRAVKEVKRQLRQ